MNPNATSTCHSPLKVGIFGTPADSGNRGVRALAESLILLCREASPGVEVVLFGSDRLGKPVTMWPDGTPLVVSMVHWRLSPRSALRDHLGWIVSMAFLYRILPFSTVRAWIARKTPWIAALEEMDIIGDVRGGDSFSDIYGIRRFLISSLPIWTALAVKGSMIQFPQTYGPFKSRTARITARYILLKSSTIIARDTRSLMVAQEMVGTSKVVKRSPDVAFALHVRSPSGPVQCDPPLAEAFPAGVIGLNVNGLLFNGGYNRSNMFGLNSEYRLFMVDLASALLANHDGELVLVPHTIAPAGDIESDNEASFLLRDALPPELGKRVRIITGDYDAHELKSIIGRCEFFIGSRMHACIAALSQGVPCVGIAYSMKFAGVFDSVGMKEWVVDAREVDAPEAISRILGLLARRNEVSAELASDSAAAAVELRRVFSKLFAEMPCQNITGQSATMLGASF